MIEIDFYLYKNLSPTERVQLPEELSNYLQKTPKVFITKDKEHRYKERLITKAAIKIKQNLVKVEKNWYVIDEEEETQCKSNLKIVMENGKAFIEPADNIFNILPISEKNKPFEAVFSKKTVKNHIGTSRSFIGRTDYKNVNFALYKNRGMSLEKVLPFNTQRYGFEFRVQFAEKMCDEIAKRTDPKDYLEPDNIYYKLLGTNDFQINYIPTVTFFDSEKISYFRAPETIEKGPSQKADIYFLVAILGQVFGASDILKFKKETQSTTDLFNQPFCLDGIFEGYVKASDQLETELKTDIVDLIRQCEKKNPDERPDIEYLKKFFQMIPIRRNVYIAYSETWQKFEMEFTELANLYQKMGLTSKLFNLNDISATGWPKKNFSLAKTVAATAIQKQNELMESISKIPNFERHSSVIKHVTNEVEYKKSSPIEQLELVTENIRETKKYLNKFSDVFKILVANMMLEERFKNTNSTGAIQMLKIIDSSETPIAKLEKMRAIAQAKIKPGLMYWYSRSHIFGKGRHENVEKLYQSLAKIDISENDSLATESLKTLKTFVSTNSFV